MRTSKDGGIKSGFFRNESVVYSLPGRLNGFGIAIYSDGDSFHGEWKENERHGQGTYTWGQGPGKGSVYKGSWEGNQRNGHGTLTYNNGDIYVGNWLNDNKHGHGKKTFKESGKVEEGEWKDNKFIG